MEWTGTPDDPHGYMKLRVFLADAAERVDATGHAESAERLRIAGSWVGMPSEFMGESALALKAALALEGLPTDLVTDMDDALSAIRTGFQRAGDVPNF